MLTFLVSILGRFCSRLPSGSLRSLVSHCDVSGSVDHFVGDVFVSVVIPFVLVGLLARLGLVVILVGDLGLGALASLVERFDPDLILRGTFFVTMLKISGTTLYSTPQ